MIHVSFPKKEMLKFCSAIRRGIIELIFTQITGENKQITRIRTRVIEYQFVYAVHGVFDRLLN